MPRPHASVRLPVPPEQVWVVVADPLRDSEWCDAVRSCELIEGQGGHVGARYRFTEGFSKTKLREGSIEITHLDPPTRMVTVAETSDRRYEITYELAPDDDGGTVLTQTSDARFTGAAGTVTVLFAPMMAWQMKRQFARLRRLLARSG